MQTHLRNIRTDSWFCLQLLSFFSPKGTGREKTFQPASKPNQKGKFFCKSQYLKTRSPAFLPLFYFPQLVAEWRNRISPFSLHSHSSFCSFKQRLQGEYLCLRIKNIHWHSKECELFKHSCIALESGWPSLKT